MRPDEAMVSFFRGTPLRYPEIFSRAMGSLLDYAGSLAGRDSLCVAKIGNAPLEARMRKFIFLRLGVAAALALAAQCCRPLDEETALQVVLNGAFAQEAASFVSAFDDQYYFLLSRLSELEKDYLRQLLA